MMKTIIDTVTQQVNPTELKSHLDLHCHWKDFYLNNHTLILDLRQPNCMTSPHWHSHIEVNIPLDGSIEYHINGHNYVLHCGEIGLFLALIPHQVVHTDCCELAILYFPVDQLFAWDNLSMLQHILAGKLLQLTPNVPLKRAKFMEWLSESQSDNIRLCEITRQEIKLFIQRLSLLYSPSKPSHITNKSLKHIISTLLYISQQFDRNLTLSELASITKTNKNYLSTLFTQTLGISIKQYIINLRLSYALALIKEGELAITDIIYHSGFQSKNSFYYAFKKSFGCSPKNIKATALSNVIQ
ncbi:helix-turn-helix domain-containing protein [Gallibacterium trehalosifermentans]|uniref:Helix-turn-helix domain-containing protein n=1 Tax=Gallibacterium trehalosifermentans TaxID=516935 RepID=A0ABV6H1L1_9PAST